MENIFLEINFSTFPNTLQHPLCTFPDEPHPLQSQKAPEKV